MGRKPGWTSDQDLTIRTMWDEGWRQHAIATRLHKTESSIASRLRSLGLKPKINANPNHCERDHEAARAHNVFCDGQFQAALQKAIADGLEVAPIPVVDTRPMRPSFFPTRLTAHGSHCSSSALACAELGQEDYR
jgi:hypothetical protein